jgi:hypothetical protein
MRLSIWCANERILFRPDGIFVDPCSGPRYSNPDPQFLPMRRRAISAIEPKGHRISLANRKRRETTRFELLVGELSAAMALAPADSVDGEIESWLAKICQALVSIAVLSMSAMRPASLSIQRTPGIERIFLLSRETMTPKGSFRRQPTGSWRVIRLRFRV